MKNYVSEYNQQAMDFLQECNATINIEYVGISINKNWNNEKRKLYNITIDTPKGSYTFDFWGSAYSVMLETFTIQRYMAYHKLNDYDKAYVRFQKEKKNNTIVEYDILSCLTKYDSGTFEEFCWSFGYDTDSRKALEIYLAVQNEYFNLCRIFTSEQLDKLAEIQ